MVEVKLNEDYLEFYLDEKLIYDFPKNRLEEFKKQLFDKKWFSNILYNKCLNLINLR